MLPNVLTIESRSNSNTRSLRQTSDQQHGQLAAPVQTASFAATPASTSSASSRHQLQYPRVQIGPILTQNGLILAGSGGTPSTSAPGLGAGVGGTLGRFSASECALILALQCLDTIQKPVCPPRLALAVMPIYPKLLAGNSRHSRRVANKPMHRQRVRLKETGK